MRASNESAVRALRELRRNWDSYGASPIGEMAIQVVESFQVFPTATGGVQFRLRHGRWETELEFDSVGTLISFSHEIS